MPGKSLAEIDGRPMVAHVLERAASLPLVDEVVLATTVAPQDDPLCDAVGRLGIPVFRGSEADVLDRYYACAAAHAADQVVRVTADCPLLCISEGARVIAHQLNSGPDYTHNLTVWGSGLPLGTGLEIMTSDILERSWRNATKPAEREHVDEWAYAHRSELRFDLIEAPAPLHAPELSLTVDTAEDLDRVRLVAHRVGGLDASVDLREVLAVLGPTM